MCGLTCGHPFPHHRVGSNLKKASSLRPPLAEVSSRCKKKRGFGTALGIESLFIKCDIYINSKIISTTP